VLLRIVGATRACLAGARPSRSPCRTCFVVRHHARRSGSRFLAAPCFSIWDRKSWMFSRRVADGRGKLGATYSEAYLNETSGQSISRDALAMAEGTEPRPGPGWQLIRSGRREIIEACAEKTRSPCAVIFDSTDGLLRVPDLRSSLLFGSAADTCHRRCAGGQGRSS